MTLVSELLVRPNCTSNWQIKLADYVKKNLQ